jgi:hypothetical protein
MTGERPGAFELSAIMRSRIKLNPIWASKKMAVLDGRQVRCMTFDEGSVWIHALDELPPPVRRRLANGRFNICPTCTSIETVRNGPPSLRLYFAVIEAIEDTLERAERRFNESRSPIEGPAPP